MRMQIKQAGWMTRVVILAIILYAVGNLITVRSALREAEAYRVTLTRQVQVLTGENQQLEQALARADDPAVIEQIARSRLGLVTPGEKIFCEDTERE